MTGADALRERLGGTPTIGVIGLGYVELPLAVAFAESGARVLGIDLDTRRVEHVHAGRSFVEDVPTATLAPLAASSDVAALAEADAIVICVPMPLGKSKEPDVSFIVGAADAVGTIIRRGQPVVLESTTYPRTTQEILREHLPVRQHRAGQRVRDHVPAPRHLRVGGDPGGGDEAVRVHALLPGPGLGGHCLPSDPHYLSWKVRIGGYEPRFITFADEINRQMPGYVVGLVADALNDRGRALHGSRILVLGVAYKPNVGDTRDSPALEILETLVRKGARVEYHDPLVPAVRVGPTTLASIAWSAADLGGRDLVLILTPHDGYDWKAIVRDARLVVDTRNATGSLSPAPPNVLRL